MIEILMVLLVVSISCAILGSILLQKQSLMIADTLSHTVLLGIVISYLLVRDLDSPWLFIGAVFISMLTVTCIDKLVNYFAFSSDAANSLIYSTFFAFAVLLISKYLSNIHLDTDMVLVGQVELSPLVRVNLLGMSLNKALVISLAVLFVIGMVIGITYPQLKIILFDPDFSQVSGIPVKLINRLIILLVSITCITAFESVGAILVVALMAGPAMTARMISTSFASYLSFSILIGGLNACLGYWIGFHYNVSMAPVTACITYFTFMTVFCFSKKRTHQ